MLFLISLLLLGSLLLMAYCMLEVATTPPERIRGVPKPVWFVVLLAPVLGALLWCALGRPEKGAVSAVPGALPPPGRAAKAPDDDEAFLRDLRRRAEEQRRQAEMKQRRDDEQQRRWAEEQKRRRDEEQKRRRDEGPHGRGEGDRPA
jgi:hypothetical protein